MNACSERPCSRGLLLHVIVTFNVPTMRCRVCGGNPYSACGEIETVDAHNVLNKRGSETLPFVCADSIKHRATVQKGEPCQFCTGGLRSSAQCTAQAMQRRTASQTPTNASGVPRLRSCAEQPRTNRGPALWWSANERGRGTHGTEDARRSKPPGRVRITSPFCSEQARSI